MSWYRDAETELIDVAAAVQGQRLIQMERLESLAAQLVLALKQSDELIVEALSGPAGTPLITNLLNAAILGTKVGVGLGYYGKELERLALAGLVHDIGLFAVPQSLVTKAGRLTHDERTLIEQHPELGYQVIRRAGPGYEWLAQVVRQAHERSHGQGYPNRLKGRQVSEMAQILGVVDVFDALVSDRPYRHRLLPHQAVKELLVAERAAFPREILKALVEQLSVYPLGTTVRLTTGEVGTVVHVNIRYPLRPVVRVNEHDEDGSGLRQVDLSLTPLVSIIEALNPPEVGRVSFSKTTVNAQSPRPVGLASDHFTSLLESLDAIATAIQKVVEIRIAPHEEDGRSGDAVVGVPRESVEPNDLGFRKEIVGLFALEAREWLAQVQMALKKLGGGVEGTVRSRLYGFMLNGITNLAKSASTVGLVEIESMASNLLPILRDVGGAHMESIVEAVRPLQAGLDRIATAVHRLADGDQGGEITATGHAARAQSTQDSETEKRDWNRPPEEEGPTTSAIERPQVREEVAATIPLLSALRELQRARARSMQPARDVLEAVIQHAEQESEESNHHIDVKSIERILSTLDRLDDHFLREVHERVPASTTVLAQLRTQRTADWVTQSQLDPILAHVESLHDTARTLHAATITMFLQGVKSFLAATADRKLPGLPQRLEAVEERLNALVPMAEQWVSLGRLERAAIAEILPA